MNKKYLVALIIVLIVAAVYELWPSAKPAPAPAPAAAPAAAPTADSTGAPAAAPAAAAAASKAAAPTSAPSAAPAPAPASAPAAAMAPAAAGQKGPTAGALMVQVEQWNGTVVSNDVAGRRLTLKNSQGAQHTFTVHKQVSNLSAAKVGDTVTVDFIESTAIEILPPNSPVMMGKKNQTAILAPSGHSEIMDAAVVQVDVTVTAVNQATRQLTVKTKSGSTHTIRVDPGVQAFSQVKVGDEILVRATEALVVTLKK